MAECWKEREGGWEEEEEELEYLNNLAPCGWNDRSVILKEGPAAGEMRACNETQTRAPLCECVLLSLSGSVQLIWQVFSHLAVRLVIERAGVT